MMGASLSRNLLLASILVVLSLLVLAGCAAKQPVSTTSSVEAPIESFPPVVAEPELPAEPATVPAQAPAAAPVVQTFKLTAQRFFFTPATIEVPLNSMVRLVITSMDTTHGFSLPAFGINRTLEPNKATVIEFTANQAGTFPFVCSVFCGQGHGGMRGTL